MLSERNQIHLLSGFTYIRFKIKPSSSVVLEVRIMVTWALELDSEWKRQRGASGYWQRFYFLIWVCSLCDDLLSPLPLTSPIPSSLYFTFTSLLAGLQKWHAFLPLRTSVCPLPGIRSRLRQHRPSHSQGPTLFREAFLDHSI